MVPKKWYQDIFTIKEENALLSQKIVQLSLLNSELSNYKYENEKLREMLEFKKSSNPLSLAIFVMIPTATDGTSIICKFGYNIKTFFIL